MQDEMQKEMLSWFGMLNEHPQLETLAALIALVLVAVLANWVVKHIMVRGFYTMLSRFGGSQHNDFGVVKRLSNIVPALIITSSIALVPGLPPAMVAVIKNVTGGFIILTIALALGAILEIVNMLYMRRQASHLKPIKGYIQIIKNHAN